MIADDTLASSVLVVDDDCATRMLMCRALEKAGFTVFQAGNGREALVEYDRSLPDIVLLDVEMPEMDGFAACAELRGRADGDVIPIIMVTGCDDADSVHRAYEIGATDFIAKPVNWAVFGHRIRYIARTSLAYRRLRQSERRVTALLRAIPDTIVTLGRDGRCVEVVSGGAADGKFEHVVAPPGVLEADGMSGIPVPAVEAVLAEGGLRTVEFELASDVGTTHCEARLVACDSNEALAIIRDVSELKCREAEIRQLAYFDTLTGLPNRRNIEQKLKFVLYSAFRQGSEGAVLFLDLDHFKNINDTMGHAAGDDLLRQVGARLEHSLRGCDLVARESTAGNVARIGGDEFIIVLSQLRRSSDAALVAQRLCAELARSFDLGTREVFVSPSIGIAVFPADGEDAGTLLKNADTAMYRAKSSGRNTYCYYTDAMSTGALERLNLESDLRNALLREEFLLHYQPQIDVSNGNVVGVEALVRWQHPERGLVPPSDFIPIAEDTGLIMDLGRWVMRTACLQNKRWQEAGPFRIPVAVNVAARQVHSADFVDEVAAVLAETGLSARYLDLELTESALMQDAGRSAAKLQALRDMGVRISMDDFGTGYSSLSCIKQFPLSALKIDRSFVMGVGEDVDDAAIVEAILALARILKVPAVAEGVETEEQLEFLRARGCRVAQGFYLGRPITGRELETTLARAAQAAAS